MLLIDYYAIAIGNVAAHLEGVTEDLLRHQILNSIRSYRKRFHHQYGEPIICMEGSSNWRKDYFPEYKGARRKNRDTDKKDWQLIFDSIRKVATEIKETFPYSVLQVEECEADDIIGHLVESTQQFGQCEDVLIVSRDGDFKQLQRYTNVRQYSPIDKKFLVEKNPSDFLSEHILRGDKGDGIPNVLSPNNTFVDGLRQTPLTKDKLQMLLSDPKSLGDEVYKNYIRNKTLIDLRETPEEIVTKILNTYSSDCELQSLALGFEGYQRASRVMNYLMKNNCRNLMEVAGDFTNG